NPATEVQALLEDHEGAVWIGTDGNGLFRHNGLVPAQNAVSPVELITTSYPKILSLMEDRENNLWVGTGGGGLDRISPRGVQMARIESVSALVGIQSVCEDGDGRRLEREAADAHVRLRRRAGLLGPVKTGDL